jgi:hypothetical protein
MTVADRIVALLLQKRTSLSAKEIAAALFGPEKGYLQRIGEVLRNLLHQGRIECLGAGGSRQPYR